MICSNMFFFNAPMATFFVLLFDQTAKRWAEVSFKKYYIKAYMLEHLWWQQKDYT